MRPRVRSGVVVTAVSVAVSFLTVCVPGVGSAHASDATSVATAGTSWAYGTLRTASGHGTAGLTAWEASETLGFAVVLTESPASGGAYTVEVNRTMGLLVSVEYCRLSCLHPSTYGMVQEHAWEAIDATLALTSAATVNVSGANVTAVGLTSSHLAVDVGLSETTVLHAAGVYDGSRNLSVDVSGDSGTTFTPALGLVPTTLSGPTDWNSSSAFAEAGEANWTIAGIASGYFGSGSVAVSGHVPLAASGSVALAGTFGGATVPLAGTSYDAFNVTLTGPFVLREGFLLVPVASDLFGSAPPAWLAGNDSDASGSASVSQASVDVAGDLLAGAHLGFAASGTKWSYGTDDPSLGAPLPGSPAAEPALSPAAGSGNASYLQGSPESVGQATTDQGCLAHNLGCPSGAGPKSPLRFALLVGAVAVVAVLAAVVIAERRRLPPPPYPNAALYPPGGPAAVGPPSAGRRPGRPSAPPDDDPLNHLW
ncbi:MAG TPA: hypothetical protein VMI55_00900 [Thermoplasmata archaeon]|nr:hypothetical protein [Thermoplasmata archaeon]